VSHLSFYTKRFKIGIQKFFGFFAFVQPALPDQYLEKGTNSGGAWKGKVPESSTFQGAKCIKIAQ